MMDDSRDTLLYRLILMNHRSDESRVKMEDFAQAQNPRLWPCTWSLTRRVDATGMKSQSGEFNEPHHGTGQSVGLLWILEIQTEVGRV